MFGDFQPFPISKDWVHHPIETTNSKNGWPWGSRWVIQHIPPGNQPIPPFTGPKAVFIIFVKSGAAYRIEEYRGYVPGGEGTPYVMCLFLLGIDIVHPHDLVKLGRDLTRPKTPQKVAGLVREIPGYFREI